MDDSVESSSNCHQNTLTMCNAKIGYRMILSPAFIRNVLLDVSQQSSFEWRRIPEMPFKYLTIDSSALNDSDGNLRAVCVTHAALAKRAQAELMFVADTSDANGVRYTYRTEFKDGEASESYLNKMAESIRQQAEDLFHSGEHSAAFIEFYKQVEADCTRQRRRPRSR